MGLPIKKIVISSNKNDILTRFFDSGKMGIKNTYNLTKEALFLLETDMEFTKVRD